MGTTQSYKEDDSGAWQGAKWRSFCLARSDRESRTVSIARVRCTTTDSCLRWDKTSYEELRKEQEGQSSASQRPWEGRPMKNKSVLAKQAQELLSGTKKWQPMPTI